MIWYNEVGYLELMYKIINCNNLTPDRTGVGRIREFGQTIEFDLTKSHPVFNHRPMPYRQAFEEFWFFLNGGTDTKELEEKGVKFWQGNTSKDFLKKRGLGHLAEGSYGKAYGFQLRNFNGKLLDGDSWGGVDQIEQVVDGLKNDPFSARHIVTMWNPNQLSQMALPPCWFEHQFVVTKDQDENLLNLRVTARSADLLFGTPANCFQYGVYLVAMSKLLKMQAGKLVVNIGDAHLYGNQVDFVNELLSRDYIDSYHMYYSAIVINKELNTLEDFLSLQWTDIELIGYEPNRTPFMTPKPAMAV